jgi:hypothetical protein
MVTKEFGTPIYIAPTIESEVDATDKVFEAEIWNQADTESAVKLKYFRYVTGWDLQFEEVAECV